MQTNSILSRIATADLSPVEHRVAGQLAEIKQLIEDLDYNSWEAGVHNGQGDAGFSRQYASQAAHAKQELLKKLGLLL